MCDGDNSEDAYDINIAHHGLVVNNRINLFNSLSIHWINAIFTDVDCKVAGSYAEGDEHMFGNKGDHVEEIVEKEAEQGVSVNCQV